MKRQEEEPILTVTFISKSDTSPTLTGKMKAKDFPHPPLDDDAPRGWDR